MPVDATAQAELLSHVSSLSASDSAAWKGFLTLEECFSALSGMARGKAPGCNGSPMEFFLKFWHILGQDLVDVLNFSFLSGRFSRTQRRGVISLSCKKDDRLDPKNWRPISLLNVPYLPVYKSIPCISRPPILELKNKFFLFLCRNFLEKLLLYLRISLQICYGFMKKTTASLDVNFTISLT